MRRWLALCFGLALIGCRVGEGEGEVTSERLFVRDCWNGPFDLNPTFFAAEPAAGDLMIRVQHGDNYEEVSDGLIVHVRDLDSIRDSGLGADLKVGMPPGVSPPGVPVQYDPDPPAVSLALYLNATCHAQNGTIYSVGGTINFSSIFSGDRNESDAEDRLTDATFEATFADPRNVQPGTEPDPAETSVVSGWFRFYFERGQPAQAFP